jgi:hypothetical protein
LASAERFQKVVHQFREGGVREFVVSATARSVADAEAGPATDLMRSLRQ